MQPGPPACPKSPGGNVGRDVLRADVLAGARSPASEPAPDALYAYVTQTRAWHAIGCAYSCEPNRMSSHVSSGER